MRSGLCDLQIRPDDQKRLQRDFSDTRIRFGCNPRTHKLEAWYKPDNSRPYKITEARDVTHAAYLLRGRAKNDRRKAKDLLAAIDEYNGRLLDAKRIDAMTEIRSELRKVASGRMIFTGR